MKVRTRIAPSPTGYVHIGTIHNALFAHALARKNNGDFILRVEDTDRKRFVEDATSELIKILDEFGLNPDEGPVKGGPHAPYIQSERLEKGIYDEAAKKLVESGHAYYCFLTEEELKEIKGGKIAKNTGGFRSPYRDAVEDDVKAKLEEGLPYVIRLKVPENEEIEIEDAILGKVTWNTHDIDDQILVKSDGFPTYHLAVVVDDNAMQISHVTRAYEWLPSTPKQVLLYRYLGYELPVFAHSSLILDPDGGKLSKRKGTVSAKQFLVEGYLPDAIKNFLMLLGWAPPIERVHGEKERELFTQKEFIQLYKLEDRQKHNAIFNREKLDWFNQQYIKAKSGEELSDVLIHWLEEYALLDETLSSRIVEDTELSEKLELVKERAKTLVEIVDMIKFFYISPREVDWEIKQLKRVDENLGLVKEDIIKLIEAMDNDSTNWTNDEWAGAMKDISEKYDLKVGDSFMVLRVAIVGGPFSPPLFEAIQILGKDEVLNRLQK